MGIVQVKQGSSNTSPLAITLDNPTTAGNSLIIVVAVSGTSSSPSISTPTLGGAADNFVRDFTAGDPATDASVNETWRDQPCTGGQTAVSIAFTGGAGTFAIFATVYECDDLAASPFDKTASSVNSGSTSWSSTATATTSQASERCFGSVFGTNAPAGVTVTGPSSPWVNQAQLSIAQGTFNSVYMSGSLDLVAPAAATYSGTFSSSDQFVATVVTYKLLLGSGVAAKSNRPSQSRLRHHHGARRQQQMMTFGTASGTVNPLTLAATTVLNGAVTNSVGRNVTATAVVNGSVTRSIGKTLTGITVLNGSLTRQIGRLLTGTTVVTGSTVRRIGRSLTAAVAVVSTMVAGSVRLVSLACTAVLNGAVTRSVGEISSALLSPRVA